MVYSIQFFFDNKVLLLLNRIKHGEGLMKSIGTRDPGQRNLPAAAPDYLMALKRVVTNAWSQTKQKMMLATRHLPDF